MTAVREWLQDPRRGGMHLGQVRMLERGQRTLVLDLMAPSSADVLTLSLTRRDTPTEAQRADAFAVIDTQLVGRLTFGVGTFAEEVEIDWINGTLVVVPTGNIRLECFYPAEAGASPWNQEVGAHATLGMRGGGAGSLPLVRRTDRVGTVPGGTTGLRRLVPARSQAVRLLLSDPTLYGAIRLGFLATASLLPTAAPRLQYQLTPGGGDAMPFSTAVRAIDITNISATAVDLTLLHDLAL